MLKFNGGIFSGMQFLQHNLNTSYVKVQLLPSSPPRGGNSNLNTSYVKVQ